MVDSPDPTPVEMTGPDLGTEHGLSDAREFRESIEDLSASLSEEIETLVSELRSRWRRGDRATLESLGIAFERIASNEEQLLARVRMSKSTLPDFLRMVIGCSDYSPCTAP
jgi:hypothetical protein